MPISFRFDPENIVVREVGSGVLTVDEFVDNLAKLEAVLPEGSLVRVLTDYREITGEVSTEAVAAMKHASNQMLERRNASARTAVVVSQQLHFGLVRMYSMLEDTQAFDVAVFTSIEEAEAWLEID